MATLVLAGPRIGELLNLRWRDVDLARGTLTIRVAKTDAGVRTVNVLPALRDELLAYRVSMPVVDPADYAFATSRGGRRAASNVRRRILAAAVEIANERISATGADGELVPAITPHSLRRTFASVLVALGENPRYVMAQLGHTDPNLTLRIYAQVMDRRDGEPDRLRALVNGEDWAPAGTRAPDMAPEPSAALAA